MSQTNRYQLEYFFKPDSEHIAVEVSKIFELFGANSWNVTTKYVHYVNVDEYQIQKGEVWRHEVWGAWYTKRRAKEVRLIINEWLGGE